MRRHPPVQAMVQGYLGIESASAPAVDQTDAEIEAEFASLAQLGLM